MEDRRSTESQNRAGGAAGVGDGGRRGAALLGSSEPDLRLEEAAFVLKRAGFRERQQRPRRRALDPASARQDRPAHRGAGSFSEEVLKMSAGRSLITA